MGVYDVTFKSIFRSGGSAFLMGRGIDRRPKALDTDVSSIRDRRVDFLAETSKDRLLHIEFQSTPDPTMTARMLGYYSDIMGGKAVPLAKGQRFRYRQIRQIVVYAGSRSWSPDTIDHSNLRYSFEFVDLRRIPAAPLLQGDTGDAALAILCRGGASPAMIRRIVEKIAHAPLGVRERNEALVELGLLARLRGVQASVEKESSRMGMIINVEDSPLFREPIDRAFSKGMASIVEDMIRERFETHELPGDLQDRLSKLDSEALRSMRRRIADAASIENLFDEEHRDAPPLPVGR